MKKLICLTILLCSLIITAPALAITISLDPFDQNVVLGDVFYLDLNVSDLNAGGPDSLGAFSLDITFDETLFTFDSVVFGEYLGDPSFFEADTYYDDSIPGSVYVDEVSWLFDWELDLIQPDSFTLATLTFTGSSIGNSLIEIGKCSIK